MSWDMGPLRKPYCGSYVSELMSCKYNDMINTVMDSFRQLDCGYHAQQLSNIYLLLQSHFYWMQEQFQNLTC